MKQNRIAIFISGRGTNALNLSRYFQNHQKVEIALIFSTRPNEIVQNFADDFKVPFVLSCNSTESNWQDSALSACRDYQIDFIVLAGFLKKITPIFVEHYSNRIVNIHPSLLPKFGGKGMYGKYVHEAVVAAGEKKSGITIHYVNEEFDKGKIIAQFEIELTKNETPESLANKIHALEMEHFPKVLEELLFERY
jgi:phosphoribosylglycinamide formyltransferase-1